MPADDLPSVKCILSKSNRRIRRSDDAVRHGVCANGELCAGGVNSDAVDWKSVRLREDDIVANGGIF